MSKNLTRKGLVLGTAAALVSTAFAGSPAFAAGEVVFEPSTGTSYNTFITEPLTLAASLAPGQVAGNIVQLKYSVTVPTGVTLQHKVNGAASYTDLAATGVIAGSGSSTAANTILVGIKYTAGTTAPVATAESISVPVTAWLDSDNDNVVDAAEFQQARTIGFKKYSEVVPTVAITAPAAADASVKATVALADVNVEQLGVTATAKGNIDVTFTNSGTGTLAGSTTKADGVFTNTFSAGTLAADAAITARATYRTVALGAAAVSATVSARSIIQPTAAVVAGDNGVATGNIARTNSAFTVAATIKDTTAAAAVKSGVAVSAVVSSYGTLSATRTLSINGTVYTSNASVPASLALTSSAAGLASVNLVTVGFAATDAPVVTFSAQNFDVAVTVDLQDAAYTVVSSAIGSAERSIVEGGSATFNYVVKDQFGVAIAAGSRLKFVVGYTTPVTSYVALSDGKASITVTDTTASTASAITVAAGLQTQDTASSNWAPDTTTVNAATQTVNVTATAVAFDGTPAAASVALSTNVALTGVSVNNAGAAVTIASKGVTFTVDSVEYKDTVTVYSASSTGNITVSAKSDIAGAHTVTYTAGSATQSAVLTIAVAPSNTGVTLSIASAKNVKSGSTLVVTGLLTDKFGNPVAVTHAATSTPASTDRGFVVAYDGPGLIIGSLPTATDANGKFTFRVLLGAGDSGAATTTVSYDLDGGYASIVSTTPASSAAAITASTTSLIGVSATVSAGSKKANVVVKNSTGLTVTVVSGTKSVTKIATSDSYKVSLTKLTAGKKTVKVYVNDILVSSKSVTVKK